MVVRRERDGRAIYMYHLFLLVLLHAAIHRYKIIFKSRGRGFSCTVRPTVSPSRFDREARRMSEYSSGFNLLLEEWDYVN